MAWETASNYFAGQGVVLMGARDTTGAVAKAGGLFEVGNCSELKLSVNTSTVEHKETTTGARAIDLRLTTEVKANMECTIENFSAKNLSQAMRGNSVTSVSGTVTGEVFKAYPGMVTPLNHIKISAVVVKQGVTTLVLGTDYLLNTEAGSIKFLEGGALAAGEDALVSYSYAAQEEVHGLTQPMQTIWLRFEGLNSADTNKPVVLDVFKFSTDPLKELELIGDKVNAFQLAGTVLADLSQGSGVSRYWKLKLLK
jgi:hypothetical protein